MRDSPTEAPAAAEDDPVLRGDLWMGDTRLFGQGDRAQAGRLARNSA